MTELTRQELGVLRKIQDGALYPPKLPVSPVLFDMHRMGYIRMADELCGPLALKTGGKLVRITPKGLSYLQEHDAKESQSIHPN